MAELRHVVAYCHVRKVLDDGNLGVIEIARKDRLNDNPDGTTRMADFSGGDEEVRVVDGDLGEKQPCKEHKEHIIFKLSKKGFQRLIEGEFIHMVSQEPHGGFGIAPPLIKWVLNVLENHRKFALCFRVPRNSKDADKFRKDRWGDRKFYFQLYAKAKSPDIYLALKSADSPTWKVFVENMPEEGAEISKKITASWLTDVFKGTIAELGDKGFDSLRADWATAKRMAVE